MPRYSYSESLVDSLSTYCVTMLMSSSGSNYGKWMNDKFNGFPWTSDI